MGALCWGGCCGVCVGALGHRRVLWGSHTGAPTPNNRGCHAQHPHLQLPQGRGWGIWGPAASETVTRRLGGPLALWGLWDSTGGDPVLLGITSFSHPVSPGLTFVVPHLGGGDRRCSQGPHHSLGSRAARGETQS